LHDVDADGDLDIVNNGYWWETPGSGNNYIPDRRDLSNYKEHNIDSFHYTQSMDNRLNNSAKMGFGDFNQDGRTDVAIATAEGDAGYIAWYECPEDPGSGSKWKKHRIQTIQNCHQLHAADMDLDGDQDIIGGQCPHASQQVNGVFVWYNKNKGTSWERQEVSPHGIYSGIVEDIANDGDTDIIGPELNKKGFLWIYENSIRKADDTK
jgi:hypothetical protein